MNKNNIQYGLVLAHSTDPNVEIIGGGTRYMRSLLRQAIKKGMEVNFIGVKIGNLSQRSFEYAFIPLVKGSDKWWRYFFSSLFKVPFLKLDPDSIIHVQRLLYLLPYVVFHPSNPKVLTSDQPMVTALMSYPKIFLKLLVHLFNAIERFILKRIDAVIAAEHVLDSYFEQKYPQLKGIFKRDILPATGVNNTVFKCQDKETARNALQIPVDTKVVLFVGRLSRIKGIKFLIEAFGEYLHKEPQALFLIVGSGEDEEELKSYHKQESFRDNILFLGVKTGKDLVNIYNSADVLVIGSVAEGNSTVLREALTCGIPVVSTDVGDARHILTDLRLGRVVSERDPKVFAEAIREVLSQDEQEVRETCTCKAVQFSEEHTFESVFGLYQEILSLRQENG